MNKTYQNDNNTEDEKEKIQKEANKEKAQNPDVVKKIFGTNLRKIEESLKKPFLPPQTIASTKFGDLKDRTIWTILMLLMFIFVILLGNFYCSLLVLIVISLIFSELIDLSAYKERNQELRNYYLWNWWFFFVCIFYFYMKLIYDKLSILLLSNKFTALIYNYHSMISFLMYIMGVLIFLNSLQKGKYNYQFRVFGFNHIVLLIFGVQSSLMISNLFNGLVWFILPCGLVICNDISAYIFGRLFGKTQLSALSPKKTIEGFVGGMFMTIIWCYVISELLINQHYLLCPIKDITLKPFYRQSCDTSELTNDYIFDINIYGKSLFIITLKQIHFHTFFMGLFASLLAPLGGLFASGFKRAIKIKDFALTIPGHGGITDRMDCQILMGSFTYIWTYHFLFFNEVSKFNYILTLITSLNEEDKMKVYEKLKKLVHQDNN